SIVLIKRLLDGSVPGCPQLKMGVVDVRDVADLHLGAMLHPAAKGQRFLAAAGAFMWVRDIARVLKRRLGVQARRVPTRELPHWLGRLVPVSRPAVRPTRPPACNGA